MGSTVITPVSQVGLLEVGDTVRVYQPDGVTVLDKYVTGVTADRVRLTDESNITRGEN